jgi:hypothetical protein
LTKTSPNIALMLVFFIFKYKQHFLHKSKDMNYVFLHINFEIQLSANIFIKVEKTVKFCKKKRGGISKVQKLLVGDCTVRVQ